MKWCLLFLFFGSLSCQYQENRLHIFDSQSHSKVYIQPFEDFPTSYSSFLISEIEKFYPDVILLKPTPLPTQAWYEPRKRYRADILINWLKNRVNGDGVVIGLTSKDISTTKNEIKDYGIMGLGYRPGKSCVVSSFRLDKQNSKQQLFKVAIHELGHTQGLNHCLVKTCFMRDAEGGNPTDEEKEFCASCRKFLIQKGWTL